jgi:2-oxoglutarate ferredoxin oxidoreductase subunit alpha
MIEDVRLAVEGRRPIEFYGRQGGMVPSAEEILAFVKKVIQRHSLNPVVEEVML